MIITDSSRNNNLEIVIPSNAHEHEKASAHELRHYLRKLSGADKGTIGTKIIISTESERLSGNRIYVGQTDFSEKSGINASDLGPEGYLIKRTQDTLILKGADPIGTRFAAYHFLEQICGIRWFWPGTLGEDIPNTPLITIGELDIAEKPDFRMRQIGNHHETLWGMRNKLGGSLGIYGVHSFGKMVPPDKYGPLHPEYFALVKGERTYKNFNGKHGCQLCTTNPEVIELCIQYIRKFFDTHPEDLAFNISPNDGDGFCECPNCAKLDRGQTCTLHGQIIPSASGQVFNFANKIGEGIAKSHPNRYVVMLAYHFYLEPPPVENFRLHENVILQLCLHCDFNHDPAWLSNTCDTLESWKQKAHLKAIYEYFVWRGNADLPRELCLVIPEAIRRYYTAGARIFHTQGNGDFGPSGLNYYLTAKLLWNIDADTDTIINDFFNRCFGAAGPSMRRYYVLLDRQWEKAVKSLGTDYYPGSPVYYFEMFTPKTLKEIDARLESAADLAESYKTKARVEMLQRLHRYTVLSMDALNSLKALEQEKIVNLSQRWPTHIQTESFTTRAKFAEEWEQSGENRPEDNWVTNLADPDRAIALLDMSIHAWKERRHYTEQIREADIIDYWHIYHDVDRDYGFDPREKLIKLKSMIPK